MVLVILGPSSASTPSWRDWNLRVWWTSFSPSSQHVYIVLDSSRMWYVGVLSVYYCCNNCCHLIDCPFYRSSTYCVIMCWLILWTVLKLMPILRMWFDRDVHIFTWIFELMDKCIPQSFISYNNKLHLRHQSTEIPHIKARTKLQRTDNSFGDYSLIYQLTSYFCSPASCRL